MTQRIPQLEIFTVNLFKLTNKEEECNKKNKRGKQMKKGSSNSNSENNRGCNKNKSKEEGTHLLDWVDKTSMMTFSTAVHFLWELLISKEEDQCIDKVQDTEIPFHKADSWMMTNCLTNSLDHLVLEAYLKNLLCLEFKKDFLGLILICLQQISHKISDLLEDSMMMS